MKKILLLIRRENNNLANKRYITAIERFGGSVVLVRDDCPKEDCLEKLREVDGILLPGGDEVGPLDYFLIEYAVNHKLRLLGICQGMQSMALFGSADSLVEIGSARHKQDAKYTHTVILSRNSKIHDIYNEDMIMVNSHHIQTVLTSHNFSVVGLSDDDLIEAIENKENYFQIGVQWHPEMMLDYDKGSSELLRKFIE